MPDILNDRGLFWWGDTPLPANQWAPDNNVAGTLIVNSEGRAEIELEGLLSESDPFGQSEVAPDKIIMGRLKSDNRYVLATDLYRSGSRWSSNGISYEKFVAQYLLTSSNLMPSEPKVRVIDVPLNGFEEWLRIGEFKTKSTKRSFKISHNLRPDLRYHGADGNLSVVRNVESKSLGSGACRGLSIREVSRLRFRPPKSVDHATAAELYRSIGDLLIILTGSEYIPDWPTITLTTNQRCISYFPSIRRETEPPKWYECFVSFPQIQEIFGTIFFNWLKKRTDLRGSISQYLSIRRGQNIYVEHKFLSVAFAVDALHRSINCYGNQNLERRMRETFEPVIFLLGFERKLFNKFYKICADLRNEISHDGQSSTAIASGNPLNFIDDRTEILSHLFHARILLEIGLPEPMVRAWLKQSHRAQTMILYFNRAGIATQTSSSS